MCHDDYFEKKVDFFEQKFGSYEKSRTFALPLKNGSAETLKVLTETGAKVKKIEKFSNKIWKLKNNAYLCIPVRKTGPRKRILQVH